MLRDLDRPAPTNYRERIYWRFGKGVAELMMIPYSERIWQSPRKIIEVISGILYPDEDRRFHMRKSRFTDSQIMAILKQAEAGLSVPELFREHGISSATFYQWRSKYGGMDTSIWRWLPNELYLSPRL